MLGYLWLPESHSQAVGMGEEVTEASSLIAASTAPLATGLTHACQILLAGRHTPLVASGVVAQADELVQDLGEALQEALHARVRVRVPLGRTDDGPCGLLSRIHRALADSRQLPQRLHVCHYSTHPRLSTIEEKPRACMLDMNAVS